MIPAAETFLNNYRFKAGEHIGNSDFDTMAQFAIDFAKMHVQEALEEASTKVSLSYKTAILDSYPSSLIK